jgi:hypothetical protein
MPSTKHRINLTVPADLDRVLQRLAHRDETSISAKTLDLIKRAIEIEEDEKFLTIANQRDKSKGKYVAHTDAWK